MKLVTFSQLKDELGVPFSRRHVERLVDAGKFPAPVKIGDGQRGRVAWDADEVAAHYAHLARLREHPATV